MGKITNTIGGLAVVGVVVLLASSEGENVTDVITEVPAATSDSTILDTPVNGLKLRFDLDRLTRNVTIYPIGERAAELLPTAPTLVNTTTKREVGMEEHVFVEPLTLGGAVQVRIDGQYCSVPTTATVTYTPDSKGAVAVGKPTVASKPLQKQMAIANAAVGNGASVKATQCPDL